MENVMCYEDFNKICRVCLNENGEMCPLFGSSVDQMLRDVAQIKVNDSISFSIIRLNCSIIYL